ncbi:MAG: DUF3368 domain-containing protein [Caldilineaceae bacterium]|nr:DUF3368 domain-containing protein [Caldilineaceae bacterium]
MRQVVCDTGPVLHLLEAQAVELLQLAGNIYIPKAVTDELAYLMPKWQLPSWIRVETLTQPFAKQATVWYQAGLLDLGEAEAMALARLLKADWFLTDDAAARLFAQSLELEVHGSLGVLLWAAAIGHLDREQAEAALDRLSQTSLWLSKHILDEASTALQEIFKE